jgi:hypothetical protein
MPLGFGRKVNDAPATGAAIASATSAATATPASRAVL